MATKRPASHASSNRAADAGEASPIAFAAAWPLAMGLATGAAALAWLEQFTRLMPPGSDAPPSALDWTTANRVALELQSMRLRDFSDSSEGTPALICAPFALHRATVADFAPGYSLVETLRLAGIRKLFVTDWRSATPELRNLTIDTLLADLNVAVDELGPPVDLIGLCQGGWLALVYAARFPAKVRRLVMAAAPVDVAAGDSVVSRIAGEVPFAAFEELVRAGDGRMLGARVLERWPSVLQADEIANVLQLPAGLDARQRHALLRRYRRWNGTVVDLPGPYYLQVVQWVFKENRIARGRFVALGRTIDLKAVRVPCYLLAARDDTLVAPDQLMAVAHLIGTPVQDIECAIEPGEHLSLFLGADTLRSRWKKIADWLGKESGTTESRVA